MRITIIPQSGTVKVDGVAVHDLSMASVADTVHAVQWYDTEGEIEHKDPETGLMTHNEAITSMSGFAAVLALHAAAVGP